MVLDALEDELISEADKLVFQWHCSAAQVTGWDDKEALFDYHSKQARHAYNVIGKTTLPWYKHWKAAERSLADLWKRFKEEEKDPVYGKYLKSRKDSMISRLEKETKGAADATERMRKMAEERKQREAEIKKRREKHNARLR